MSTVTLDASLGLIACPCCGQPTSPVATHPAIIRDRLVEICQDCSANVPVPVH